MPEAYLSNNFGEGVSIIIPRTDTYFRYYRDIDGDGYADLYGNGYYGENKELLDFYSIPDSSDMSLIKKAYLIDG